MNVQGTTCGLRVAILLSTTVILVVLPFAHGVQWTTGVQWIAGGVNDAKWENAVQCGREGDEYSSFVARVYYNNQAVLPCKALVANDNGRAAMTYCTINNVTDINKEVFEVLTGAQYTLTWVLAANGAVPENALVSGRSDQGEELYSCRVMDDTRFGISCGMLQPSSGQCLIQYTGVSSYSVYEVLVAAQQ